MGPDLMLAYLLWEMEPLLPQSEEQLPEDDPWRDIGGEG